MDACNARHAPVSPVHVSGEPWCGSAACGELTHRNTVTPYLLSQKLAECAARRGAADHGFQGTLTHADTPRAVVNTARAQAPLCNRKALAFANQQVRRWHANIVEQDLCVCVGGGASFAPQPPGPHPPACAHNCLPYLGVANGRVVVAEHLERTDQCDAWRVHRYKNHGLLGALVPVDSRLAHWEADITHTRVSRARTTHGHAATHAEAGGYALTIAMRHLGSIAALAIGGRGAPKHTHVSTPHCGTLPDRPQTHLLHHLRPLIT